MVCIDMVFWFFWNCFLDFFKFVDICFGFLVKNIFLLIFDFYYSLVEGMMFDNWYYLVICIY